VHDIDLDVEASIEIVVAGAHGQDPTTLLRHADIAMYVAKDHNLGVCAYDPAGICPPCCGLSSQGPSVTQRKIDRGT